MTRRLFELVGADPARRFSPACWRSRMALAHKGLDAESVPWRFTEADAIAFAGSTTVPVLVDGDAVVADSWRIAEYLERAYPDRPALFGGAQAELRFLAAWTDTVLNPAILRFILTDVFALLRPSEQPYFRESRERRFGTTLEAVVADREVRLPGFRALIEPLRVTLRAQPFLAGDAPAYADHIVFGSFQWARCTSPFPLLEPDDPVALWRGRMLDLHGGLARRAPGHPC
jgi:glutathione S-transferase